ncbi:coiled-coil domain-containing protein 189 isoform X3 [Heterodontus francisci]|uniref:coiled-coil domain-containing protein 189 isoform X3 n=1 Tax=Heterodontus francisci TaxID=7792 RepID=UPI00355C07DB
MLLVRREDLTFSGMDIIQKASTTEEIKQALHQLLSVSLDGTDPRAAILLDLYVYTLQFAKSHRFNKEQTSGFFSIVKRLHQACTGTPLGNVKECFDYFLELVLCNSVRRPPFSVDLFNAEQVKLVTDYVLDTYFRHFKLYKYVFTPQLRLDLSLCYQGMPETPPAVEEEMPVVDQDEVPPEETEPQGEQAAAPGHELRQYIEAQLAEQVSELKTSIEGRIQAGEQQLNLKLAALEKSKGAKSPRAKKK